MDATMIDQVVLIVAMAGLVLICAVGVFLVVMQLPGTWLILLCATLAAWWRGEDGTISIWTLAALGVLAVSGEVVESLASMVGAKKAGGSRRGALLAIVGAVVGAVLGTAVLPVIGTIIGACLGAGTGSFVGDRWAGRTHEQALEAGRGAAKGRLIGTVVKVGIAVVMWVVVVCAVVF